MVRKLDVATLAQPGHISLKMIQHVMLMLALLAGIIPHYFRNM